MGCFNYKTMVADARKTGKGTEKTMEASVAHVSDFMEGLREAHPDLYWDFMRSEHSIMHDNHYSEPFALWDVGQMHHTEANGRVAKGEHFSMAEAETIADDNDIKNVADVYVAINATWHDKAVLFAEWFEADDVERRVIEDAVTFYFKDEDAPEGKIWRYMCAMMQK